jgi:hypothetical protein
MDQATTPPSSPNSLLEQSLQAVVREGLDPRGLPQTLQRDLDNVELSFKDLEVIKKFISFFFLDDDYNPLGEYIDFIEEIMDQANREEGSGTSSGGGCSQGNEFTQVFTGGTGRMDDICNANAESTLQRNNTSIEKNVSCGSICNSVDFREYLSMDTMAKEKVDNWKPLRFRRITEEKKSLKGTKVELTDGLMNDFPLDIKRYSGLGIPKILVSLHTIHIFMALLNVEQQEWGWIFLGDRKDFFELLYVYNIVYAGSLTMSGLNIFMKCEKWIKHLQFDVHVKSGPNSRIDRLMLKYNSNSKTTKDLNHCSLNALFNLRKIFCEDIQKKLSRNVYKELIDAIDEEDCFKKQLIYLIKHYFNYERYTFVRLIQYDNVIIYCNVNERMVKSVEKVRAARIIQTWWRNLFWLSMDTIAKRLDPKTRDAIVFCEMPLCNCDSEGDEDGPSGGKCVNCIFNAKSQTPRKRKNYVFTVGEKKVVRSIKKFIVDQ